MAALRHPQSGCPWDLDQTFETIVPHTLEEAYEVADAVEAGRPEALRDELGDLLFQVVFLSRLAEEAEWFDFDAVAAGLVDKLVRRHPHVFGDVTIRDPDLINEQWERIKAEERAGSGAADSVLDSVPLALPALSRAAKLGKRAARVGFDWTAVTDVRAKVDEELAELDAAAGGSDPAALGDELGDVLFSLAQYARHAGLDPETVLRGANARFERRFRDMETAAMSAKQSLDEFDAAELDAAWERAKQRESG